MTTRLVIIDSETSGLDPTVNSLLSIGVVVWEDGQIRDDIELFIAEEKIATDPESMRINKINLSLHKQHAISPNEAVRKLEIFLSKYFDFKSRIPLAGHNVSFDVGFLRRLYRLAGFNYENRFSHRLLDTASVMRFLAIAGRLPIDNPGLDAGLKYFGINVAARDRHSALGDARATAKLLRELIKLVQYPSR